MKRVKLTRKIVKDHLGPSDPIVAVLERDEGRRPMTKAILRAQRKLQKSVSSDAWKLYLRLEELVNDRASREQDVLTRWAFREGRR
jgi:hypothetical protein